MIEFDKNGYIEPYDVLIIDFDTFVRYFVINEYRVQIFEQYKNFLNALEELEIGFYHQWINGSFTSKRLRPGDIDVVTFINFKKYDLLENELRNLKKLFEKVDCYFVKDYPENHKNHNFTKFDKIEWRHLFSTDRKKNSKGFIQINFK